MRHTVLLFILVSYLSSSCHATLIQTQSQGYSFLEKLAITRTAKYFWTTSEINMNWLTYCQCRFCLGLGKNIGSSIILHNFPHNRSSYFPAHFLSKIMQWYLFLLHPTRKPTNLKVDISFKFGDRPILHSERSKSLVLLSYESKNVVIFSSISCNMIGFTVLLK